MISWKHSLNLAIWVALLPVSLFAQQYQPSPVPSSAPSTAPSSAPSCVSYPIGGADQSFDVAPNFFAQPSKDGKKLYGLSAQQVGSEYLFQPKAYDLATGKEIQLLDPASPDAHPLRAQFSPDQSLLFTVDQSGQLRLRNLVTGEVKLLPFAGQFPNYISISENNKKLVMTFNRGRTVLLDIISGKTQEISRSSEVTNPILSPDGNQLVLSYFDGRTILHDLKTGKSEEMHASSLYGEVEFSADGKLLRFNSNGGTVSIRNASEGVSRVISNNESVHHSKFSPDGQSLLMAGSHGLILRNLKTGTERVLDEYPRNSYTWYLNFTPDGKRIVELRNDASIGVLDIESGEREVVRGSLMGQYPIVFGVNDPKLLWFGQNRKAFVRDLSRTCVDQNLKIEPLAGICVSCRNQSVLDQQSSAIEQISKQALCQNDWNTAAWDHYTADASKSLAQNGKLSEDDALKLLMRFQKPEGFEPAKHVEALDAILRSDLPSKETDLTWGAMQTVLHRSPRLYDKLIEQHPILLKLKPSNKGFGSCRTSQEKEMLKVAASKYVDDLAREKPFGADLSVWKKLAPLSPALSELSAAKKDELMDVAAQSLADRAALDPRFSGVFLSKLYKLTSQAVAPLFGEKSKTLTDLTVVREEGVVRPILLATEAIDGKSETASPYGFYFRNIDGVPVNTSGKPSEVAADRSIQWKLGSKTFTGKYKIEYGNKKNLIPEGVAPKYDELWKNGTLSGAVIVGSNLKGKSADLMHEYLAYYEDQGFQFDDKKQSISDFKQYLGGQIKSGSLKYMIKEAHSDGDDRNLFRMDKKAEIMVGTKKLKNGKFEKVLLVYPSSTGSESDLLSNQEFGEWIREREKAGKGQFVYFNTSCWSVSKAVNEIEATASPALLNIPTKTSTDTFYNGVYSGSISAERLILSAFRQKKTFQEMRDELQKNAGYKSGQSNVFIFPDEDRYSTDIKDLLSIPLKIDVKVQDSSGHPYEFDRH